MKNTSFHGSNLLKLVFSPFSLTFLLGYFMGLAHPVLKRLPWTVSLLFLAAGILGLVAGISVFSSVGVYPDNNSITRLVAFGLPCAAVVMGGLILEQAKRPKFKPLLLLGDASYSIYLVHLPVLAAFYAVIKKAEIRESGQLWIAAGLCLMSCLAAGLIFHLFIEKKAILVARLRFVCKDEEPRG